MSTHDQTRSGDSTGPEIPDPRSVAPPRRPGRKRKTWRIRVLRIEPGKYPQFQNDPENIFASMSPEQRLNEIDEYFARLRVHAARKKAQGEKPKEQG